MKRIALNKDKKLQLISKWKRSGMPVKDFCLQEGISRQGFYYWLKQKKESKKPVASNFIKLGTSKSFQETQKGTEIIFLNGTRIIFYVDLDIETLKHFSY